MIKTEIEKKLNELLVARIEYKLKGLTYQAKVSLVTENTKIPHRLDDTNEKRSKHKNSIYLYNYDSRACENFFPSKITQVLPVEKVG